MQLAGVGGACWDVSLEAYLRQQGSQRIALLLSFQPEGLQMDQRVLQAWLQQQQSGGQVRSSAAASLGHHCTAHRALQ